MPVEGIVALVVVLGIIVFCILMIVLTSRARKKAKKALKQEMESRNATLYAPFKYFAGLPIPENTLCKVYSTPSGIEIVANGQQFNLAKEKIIDVSITTSTEIQKQLVSSVGGAVGGAMLFGAVGALIGGRTKTKDVKQVQSYLIFTYQKESETQYVGFDVTLSGSVAGKFVKEYRQQGNKPLMQTDL